MRFVEWNRTLLALSAHISNVSVIFNIFSRKYLKWICHIRNSRNNINFVVLVFSYTSYRFIFFTDRTVCFFLPLSYFETVILEFISACVRTESKMAGIERHMNRIQLQNEELSSLLIITFRSSWPCGESVQRGSGRRTYSDKLLCLAFF